MKHQNNKIGRILNWNPSPRFVGIAALAVLLLALVPLLRIAVYATPWYDDFLYGRFAKAAMVQDPGIVGALKGAWESARSEWYAYQGTFSSIFLMTLTPLIWGEQYYFLGCVFLILILAVSVFVLTGTLVKKILKVDRVSALGLQAVSAFMVVELIYAAPSGFYWYNGGVHYVGMHSLGMLFVAVLVQLYVSESIKNVKGILLVLAGMLGALLTGGSNFVTTLQGLVVVCSLCALVCFLDKKKLLRYLPIAAVYFFAFYKNVFAPGNQVRSRAYEGWGYPPLQAVLRSFLEAFNYLWEFTGWMTLAFLVVLAPIVWNIVGKSKFAFRLPGLVLAWSFCLYATGFTPSLYSMGHAGLSRTLNSTKITFQLLLLLNEVYWMGWLRGRLVKKERLKGILNKDGCPWWFYGLMGACMLFIFSLTANQAGSYSSYGAYYYVHSGEAYNYYSEYLARLEILYSEEANAVLEPYHFSPWMLCIGDLSEDPEREENRTVASWYGKESVVVKEISENVENKE